MTPIMKRIVRLAKQSGYDFNQSELDWIYEHTIYAMNSMAPSISHDILRFDKVDQALQTNRASTLNQFVEWLVNGRPCEACDGRGNTKNGLCQECNGIGTTFTGVFEAW